MSSPTGNPAAPDAIAPFAQALEGCKRVLVLGGYGCGNLGDEAILSALLSELRGMDVGVRVVSADASVTRITHGVATVATSPRSFVRAIAWCDAVVIGGGGIFSGYMGGRSKLLPLIALAASAARRRVAFRALGVYGGTPAPVLRCLAFAMKRAAYVSVRDEASVATLAGAGLKRTPALEHDPALRLRTEPSKAELPPRPVGLALRRVRDPATQALLEQAFVRVLDGLIAGGRSPVLLPFCDHPSEAVEQDVAYAELLRSRCSTPERVSIVRVRRPGEMLDVVGRLDALVAMRFHGIVFGAVAGTPMIALPYDAKCEAFASKHGIDAISLGAIDSAAMLAMIAARSRSRRRRVAA